jgi:DNA-binding CsgD family transcriptional regulator
VNGAPAQGVVIIRFMGQSGTISLAARARDGTGRHRVPRGCRLPNVDDLIRIQQLAWEVAAEDAPVDRGARAICEALGSCDAQASLVDPLSGDGIAEGFAYFDPSLAERMASDFSTPETNPILAAMSDMSAGRFAHHTALLNADRLMESAFFVDWWRSSGLRDHGGAIALPASVGRTAWVAVGCLRDRDWFDASELSFVSAASHAMANAMRTRAAFDLRTARASLDARGPDAAWLLDRTRRIHLANGAADALDAAPDAALRVRRGRLRLGDGARDARLERTIERVLHGRGAGAAILLADRGAFAKVTVAPGPRYRGSSCALVILERPRAMSWTAEDLRAAYDLTPREAEVAIAIAAGGRPAQIAETLGLSPDSVRVYLKRVFSKTGAAGQGPLASMLLTGRPSS